MALQYSTTVRNAKLDAVETAIGASPIMRIYSGAAPANPAAAATGTVLATINLPADWLLAAASGQKLQSGTWQDNAADAAGTAGYWRVFDSTGTTAHMQGTITATGGGGDMTVDNTILAIGQQFTVTSFGITAGNA
jgi:hypothetical protein